MINTINIVVSCLFGMLTLVNNIGGQENQNRGMIKDNSNKMIAVIYSSKYGTTEKICNTIKDQMQDSDSVELIALDDCSGNIDLSKYNTVILGTSIYAGKPRNAMVDFCKIHEKELQQKRLALFVCGMDRNNSIKEIEASYPSTLLNHSLCSSFFEGEYHLDKMKFADKLLLRVFFKVKKSKTRDYKDDVRVFVESIKG